ncbi:MULTISPECIES: hypothetical protein [unclassified Mesorhizobium]|uniref:hypothetical protein n=1 Tax=unclassified Mesorhizobium TaxID=325217 RepID=UPI0003CF4333|nr:MULTISPECIES: hypothetical protein [unclassified Mesorhizobium]ESX08906.1 hypothetical protein X766_33970 [Mesorhizobium sp. LSJC255A00]ESY26903.1 hypothetical protein X749_25020 [Mesorhizobium sp. LNJC391B00]ESY34660.1 hypothetical protein X747_29705 [Mesorhizobium sp. LNJC384A00]
METIFDDVGNGLRAPAQTHGALYAPSRIDMAGKLFLGVAIGLGLGFGMANAG